MLKTLKFNIPSHVYGRSFRQDFPISAIDGIVVGAYAHMSNFNGVGRPSRNNVIAKASLSTDNGDVVHPSLPIMFTPLKGTINKMMQPVNYKVVGNKFTVVVEENNHIEELIGKSISYDLDIMIKTVKVEANVKDINRHRVQKAC